MGKFQLYHCNYFQELDSETTIFVSIYIQSEPWDGTFLCFCNISNRKFSFAVSANVLLPLLWGVGKKKDARI